MAKRVMLNVGLAGIYVLWMGQRQWIDLVIGLAAGCLVISVFDLTTTGPVYGRRLVTVVRFGGYFLRILGVANIQIAREIVTPGFSQTPRILRYPVEHLGAVQLTVFANCITLTPGTLVVDVSEDARWLYVHCMYAADRDAAIAGLYELDRRLGRQVFS